MKKQYSLQTNKYKEALSLVEGPHLAGHIIQHSDAYRLLIIDGAIIRCTPTQYALMIRLLQQSEHHLPFNLLEQCLFMRSPNSNPRSALIRHMRRIRPKLWPFGLDILSITNYGYMLHSIPQELSEPEQEMASLPA